MGTKNFTDAPILVKRSSDSVRKFIKRYLALNETPYLFHQTLTFRDRIADESAAKARLNALLDLLRKQFPNMATLFVQELQKREGLHYHVLFLLYGAQPLSPEETRQHLSGEIFNRWNEINDGELARQANQLKLREKSLRGLAYLLKGVLPTDGKIKRQSLWHGIRQKQIIGANSHEVSKQEIRDAWRQIFPKLKIPAPKPLPQREPDIEGMKAYADWTGKAMDWDTIKRTVTGRKGKVSNEDFKRFLYEQRQPKTKEPKVSDFDDQIL